MSITSPGNTCALIVDLNVPFYCNMDKMLLLGGE